MRKHVNHNLTVHKLSSLRKPLLKINLPLVRKSHLQLVASHFCTGNKQQTATEQQKNQEDQLLVHGGRCRATASIKCSPSTESAPGKREVPVILKKKSSVNRFKDKEKEVHRYTEAHDLLRLETDSLWVRCRRRVRLYPHGISNFRAAIPTLRHR